MSQRLNKFIAGMLTVCILLSIFPYKTLAVDVLLGELKEIKTLRDKEGFTKGNMIVTDDEAAELAYIVKNNNGTTSLVNDNLQYLNVGVYKYYSTIAYGKRHNKPSESCDQYGEYRYLGYDIKGKDITNDRFQNDFPPDSTKLEEMNWVPANNALTTWSKASDTKIATRIMTYNPIKDDGVTKLYSISSILRNKVSEGSSNDEERKRDIYINTIPTLASHGSVKLERLVNGSRRYNTFTIPKFPFDPTVTVSTDKPSYTIAATETTVTAKVTVTANLEIHTDLGRTPAEALKNVYVSFEGQNKLAPIVNNKASATFDKVFKRGDSGLTESDTAGNTVKLEGFIYSMDSIYGDTWGTKHGKSIRGEKDIIVYIKPTIGPYAEITVTANPDNIKYVGEDIPVKVSATAALQGYTNVSNIREAVFFAKFDDDPPEKFQRKGLPAALNASHTFDFLIPKSKVQSDNFSQKFKVSVFFYYKDPINTYSTATDYDDTKVYKEDPPPPFEGGNLRPKAILHSPRQVKAGDPAHLDGSDSYDEDGMIVDYIFNTPGTTAPILWSNAGTVYYPEEGTYDIGLMVIDDAGAKDSVDRTIKVLPPTPEAKTKITGTLKENRKITIDASGSTSPQLYPIVWNNTTWSLQASGNSISDIKYSGVLNGSKTKDILVKKAGTDKVDIRVINTKGYSDTAYNTLSIIPDKPPIADFSTVTTVFRNPEDTNYSLITINDTSYSTDNDYIKNCILTFSYDSDNNGAFNNGNIQIDATTYTNGQTKLVTTPWGFDVPVTVYKPTNKPIQFDIKTKHVGKYFVDLKAIEGFGQETIAAFITEADYRTDDTTDKPNIEKTVEVLNLAPVAGFNMTNKRKADIVIALPDNYTQVEINSQINSKVIPGLVSNNMSYDVRYVNYDAYKPQPIDNFYYFAFSSGGDNALKIFKYDYTTGLVVSLAGGLDNSTPELFITNANKAWLIADNYHYLGDGRSTSYDTVRRYDGNGGFAYTTVFSTYADAQNDKHGPITNVTVNKEGTIFWTYKNVRYGCLVNGSYFAVGGGTYDQGKPFTEWVSTSPTDVAYSIENTTLSGKDAKRVVGTKEGVRTELHTERITPGEYEYVRLGKYYPPSDITTIDEAFNSITWKDNYERYFVPISSNVMTELDKKSIISNLISRSLINNVTIVALGNSINKTQFEGLIEKNDGNGLYTDLTNLSAAFTKLGEYILNRINVDLVFNLGQSAHTLDILKTKVNSILKSKLAAGNISASVSYISSASDMNSALNSALWSPLKDHMFIQVQDTLIADLNDSAMINSILDLLRGNEAGVIGLCRSANSSQINSLVSSNENEGTYIDNTNIDTAMNSLGDYVVANAKRKTPNVYRYLTLGEEVQYNTTYSDIENDPMYSERWKYIHNETYFENNLGKISDTGAYRTSPYTIFTKTGKYEITYGARDNPKNNNLFDNYRLWSNEELSKATLLVHRRPVASYLWSISSSGSIYVLNTTDTSEDLDHLSRADKGIVQRQWKWKLPTDTNWQAGKPSQIEKGNVYLLQLMVQDMEGAWSEPYIQEIKMPDLLIEVVPPYRDWGNTDVSAAVTVISTSAWPYFQSIDYKWTNDKIKPTSGWSSTTNSTFSLSQTATGEWYLHLNAFNNTGESYYVFKGPYRIDKIAPTSTVAKTGGVSSADVILNATVADTGGSGIGEVKYYWSDSTVKPTAGWIVANGSFETTRSQNGVWYLHIEATDNAGNVTYIRYNVPYIGLAANPTNLPWRNTNAVVNLAATVTNGTFNRISYIWLNSTEKPVSGWTNTTSTNINLTQSATGEWYLHAEAFATDGQSKYNYFGAYQIDKVAPTIVADKNNAESNEPITVNVTIADTGGSGLKDVKYKWTTSTTKPTAGWTVTSGSFSTTQDQEGTWYLHIEAKDNAGNVTYGYFGTYEVNSCKLEKFRVVMVRDLHLESFYYNITTGKYDYIPMYVNKLALDDLSFGSIIDGLTKGYKFEFEIDSRNFNETDDVIIMEPHFYTTDGFSRDHEERDIYWEDSNHKIFKVGESAHSAWKTIILDGTDRVVRNDVEATWRGEYLIPGSAWAVPKGTVPEQAKSKNLKRDILVNFHIKGYKAGELKFDYNEEQWGIERTTNKHPFIIGDVIRYNWGKNCLNDIKAKDNR